MQPHKSRYWLNTTEKDPEKFAQQAKAVCDTYLAALALEKSHGTLTVCVDEMTGMQALERNTSRRPMISGEAHDRVRVHSKRDFVPDRELPGDDGGVDRADDRSDADRGRFASHIEQTVALDPEASWVFVMDNLNTHCSETLVKLVAETCRDRRSWAKRGWMGC